MRESLFHVERLETMTLQGQIREMLVSAVLEGQLPAGSPVPSTRAMAKRLNVSRNTVISAYQALADDGYLVPRERSGFYVSNDIVAQVRNGDGANRSARRSIVDWPSRLRHRPTEQSNISKPANWQTYPYPFIYGQVDQSLFPITAWRDCMRQAMSRKWLDAWTDDRFTEDDPMLIDQIRQRVLTRRGVLARPDQILITIGAQNALHLLCSLLVDSSTRIAIEDPGYPDVRNMISLLGGQVVPARVDREGVMIDDVENCDIAFVTPSHQFPTNATMSMARRRALLDWAEQEDRLIIEDDYEYETNYIGEPMPSLKSLDKTGRVLYVGSLSKSLMPGIRLGFVVGPRALIAEARAMRRLMMRHPPGNNQRVVALFLALGHHDALIGRLHRIYAGRWRQMRQSLDAHLPGWAQSPGFGGTSFWVTGPREFDSHVLAEQALEEGIVIEPGDIYHAERAQTCNTFRLGFSSIPEDRIEPGIASLAQIIGRQGIAIEQRASTEPMAGVGG